MSAKLPSELQEMVEVERIELSTQPCKGHVFPLALHPRIIWCPVTESNCQLMITNQPLYHLTNRACVYLLNWCHRAPGNI